MWALLCAGAGWQTSLGQTLSAHTTCTNPAREPLIAELEGLKSFATRSATGKLVAEKASVLE